MGNFDYWISQYNQLKEKLGELSSKCSRLKEENRQLTEREVHESKPQTKEKEEPLKANPEDQLSPESYQYDENDTEKHRLTMIIEGLNRENEGLRNDN